MLIKVLCILLHSDVRFKLTNKYLLKVRKKERILLSTNKNLTGIKKVEK